jgi:hypothetical protein
MIRAPEEVAVGASEPASDGIGDEEQEIRVKLSHRRRRVSHRKKLVGDFKRLQGRK